MHGLATGLEVRRQRCARSRGEALDVRAHDSGNPTKLREVPQLVHAHSFASVRFLQGLQGDVKSDLVSVLESVGNCLGNIGDAHFDPVDIMLVETFSECWP